MFFRTVLCAAFALTVGAPLAQETVNPPMEGFDAEGSDTRAIEIADEVMAAMGGRLAWDNTRYLSWSFFGEDQVWDKWTGRFRWQGTDSTVVLMNINTQQGRVFRNGVEDVAADTLVRDALRDWANSGYWLMMPYKLKDSGVTLTYRGEGETEQGRAAHILGLTFNQVGFTPDNRYEVYVDQETSLVRQWSFYRNAADEEPTFVRPWDNWQRHGEIMLSDQRGELGSENSFEIPNVAVFEALDDAVFESGHWIDLTTL